jgi:hypothetical protein
MHAGVPRCEPMDMPSPPSPAPEDLFSPADDFAPAPTPPPPSSCVPSVSGTQVITATKSIPAPGPDALLEPFRGEMLELLATPFTHEDAKKTLPLLHRMVTTAIDVLRLRLPRVSRMQSCGPYGGIGYPMTPGVGMDPFADLDGSGPPNVGPQMPMQSVDREAFGASMIREIVSAAKPNPQSATELVRAIAEARSLGLDDVAKDLLQQLTLSTVAPTDVAAAALAESTTGNGPPPPSPLPPTVYVNSGPMGAT